jgi:hypothetical protein
MRKIAVISDSDGNHCRWAGLDWAAIITSLEMMADGAARDGGWRARSSCSEPRNTFENSFIYIISNNENQFNKGSRRYQLLILYLSVIIDK